MNIRIETSILSIELRDQLNVEIWRAKVSNSQFWISFIKDFILAVNQTHTSILNRQSKI